MVITVITVITVIKAIISIIFIKADFVITDINAIRVIRHSTDIKAITEFLTITTIEVNQTIVQNKPLQLLLL